MKRPGPRFSNGVSTKENGGGTFAAIVGLAGTGKSTQLERLAVHPGVHVLPTLTTAGITKQELPGELIHVTPKGLEIIASEEDRLAWISNNSDGSVYAQELSAIRRGAELGRHLNVSVMPPDAALQQSERIAKDFGSVVLGPFVLPDPGNEELVHRLVDTGHAPEAARRRLDFERESQWPEKMASLTGAYAVQSFGIEAQQAEILSVIQTHYPGFVAA
jgi:guanylate kinase